MQEAGYSCVFASPDGHIAQADRRMLTGEDLGLLKSALMAKRDAVAVYRELEKSAEFLAPLPYHKIESQSFDGVFLPGGHDKGMREYLESKVLQRFIAQMLASDKPVGAICHGTLLVARSRAEATGKSVLWGRRTTGLTKRQELIAYQLTRFYLGDYYLTYPEITLEDEVKGQLQRSEDFLCGPGFPFPLARDSAQQLQYGFTVLDGKYLSARWPGDAHRFAAEFVRLLRQET